jgi:hypothetical protein
MFKKEVMKMSLEINSKFIKIHLGGILIFFILQRKIDIPRIHIYRLRYI